MVVSSEAAIPRVKIVTHEILSGKAMSSRHVHSASAVLRWTASVESEIAKDGFEGALQRAFEDHILSIAAKILIKRGPKCDGLDEAPIIQIKPSTRNALWGMSSSDEIYDDVINRLIRHWDDCNRTIDMLQAEIEKLKKRLQALGALTDEFYENIPMGYLTGNKAVDVSHMIAYISKYHDKVLGILDQENTSQEEHAGLGEVK